MTLAVFAVVACGGEVDKDEYAFANQVVLDALPAYPDAIVKSTSVSPHYLSEQGPVSGYTTNVVYSVPPAVTDEDVIDFYLERLGGEWEHCREEIGIAEPVGSGATPAPAFGSILTASFIRSRAQVSLNTDGLHPLTRADTFEVSVDHHAHRNFCTGESLK